MNRMNNRYLALVIFTVTFALVYNFSLWYASQLSDVSSVILSAEEHIPFLPWTIVPYLSSGAFFWITFSLLKNNHQLEVFLKRVLFMTVAAGLIFVAAPLKYAYPRPEIANPLYRGLFWLLEGVDDPYNQSPSLHVAFSFAFWTVFREVKSRWRPLIAVWLAMVALSTLTTYQHHLIDVFTGSILAHFTFLLFPSGPVQNSSRNLHTANFFYLGAWCTLGGAFVLADYLSPNWISLLVPSTLLFLLGLLFQLRLLGYIRRQTVRVNNVRER